MESKSWIDAVHHRGTNRPATTNRTVQSVINEAQPAGSNPIFKCPHCVMVVCSMRELVAHLMSHELEKKPFTCGSCSVGFSSDEALQLHAREHVSDLFCRVKPKGSKSAVHSLPSRNDSFSVFALVDQFCSSPTPETDKILMTRATSNVQNRNESLAELFCRNPEEDGDSSLLKTSEDFNEDKPVSMDTFNLPASIFKECSDSGTKLCIKDETSNQNTIIQQPSYHETKENMSEPSDSLPWSSNEFDQHVRSHTKTMKNTHNAQTVPPHLIESNTDNSNSINGLNETILLSKSMVITEGLQMTHHHDMNNKIPTMPVYPTEKVVNNSEITNRSNEPSVHCVGNATNEASSSDMNVVFPVNNTQSPQGLIVSHLEDSPMSSKLRGLLNVQKNVANKHVDADTKMVNVQTCTKCGDRFSSNLEFLCHIQTHAQMERKAVLQVNTTGLKRTNQTPSVSTTKIASSMVDGSMPSGLTNSILTIAGNSNATRNNCLNQTNVSSRVSDAIAGSSLKLTVSSTSSNETGHLGVSDNVISLLDSSDESSDNDEDGDNSDLSWKPADLADKASHACRTNHPNKRHVKKDIEDEIVNVHKNTLWSKTGEISCNKCHGAYFASHAWLLRHLKSHVVKEKLGAKIRKKLLLSTKSPDSRDNDSQANNHGNNGSPAKNSEKTGKIICNKCGEDSFTSYVLLLKHLETHEQEKIHGHRTKMLLTKHNMEANSSTMPVLQKKMDIVETAADSKHPQQPASSNAERLHPEDASKVQCLHPLASINKHRFQTTDAQQVLHPPSPSNAQRLHHPSQTSVKELLPPAHLYPSGQTNIQASQPPAEISVQSILFTVPVVPGVQGFHMPPTIDNSNTDEDSIQSTVPSEVVALNEATSKKITAIPSNTIRDKSVGGSDNVVILLNTSDESSDDSEDYCNSDLCLSPTVASHQSAKDANCSQSSMNGNDSAENNGNEHKPRTGTVFCDKCGKGFPTTSSLLYHNLEVHAQKPEHKCIICNKVIGYWTDYKKHLEMHGLQTQLAPASKPEQSTVKLHVPTLDASSDYIDLTSDVDATTVNHNTGGTDQDLNSVRLRNQSIANSVTTAYPPTPASIKSEKPVLARTILTPDHPTTSHIMRFNPHSHPTHSASNLLVSPIIAGTDLKSKPPNSTTSTWLNAPPKNGTNPSHSTATVHEPLLSSITSGKPIVKSCSHPILRPNLNTSTVGNPIPSTTSSVGMLIPPPISTVARPTSSIASNIGKQILPTTSTVQRHYLAATSNDYIDLTSDVDIIDDDVDLSSTGSASHGHIRSNAVLASTVMISASPTMTPILNSNPPMPHVHTPANILLANSLLENVVLKPKPPTAKMLKTHAYNASVHCPPNTNKGQRQIENNMLRSNLRTISTTSSLSITDSFVTNTIAPKTTTYVASNSPITTVAVDPNTSATTTVVGHNPHITMAVNGPNPPTTMAIQSLISPTKITALGPNTSNKTTFEGSNTPTTTNVEDPNPLAITPVVSLIHPTTTNMKLNSPATTNVVDLSPPTIISTDVGLNLPTTTNAMSANPLTTVAGVGLNPPTTNTIVDLTPLTTTMASIGLNYTKTTDSGPNPPTTDSIVVPSPHITNTTFWPNPPATTNAIGLSSIITIAEHPIPPNSKSMLLHNPPSTNSSLRLNSPIISTSEDISSSIAVTSEGPKLPMMHSVLKTSCRNTITVRDKHHSMATVENLSPTRFPVVEMGLMLERHNPPNIDCVMMPNPPISTSTESHKTQTTSTIVVKPASSNATIARSVSPSTAKIVDILMETPNHRTLDRIRMPNDNASINIDRSSLRTRTIVEMLNTPNTQTPGKPGHSVKTSVKMPSPSITNCDGSPNHPNIATLVSTDLSCMTTSVNINPCDATIVEIPLEVSSTPTKDWTIIPSTTSIVQSPTPVTTPNFVGSNSSSTMIVSRLNHPLTTIAARPNSATIDSVLMPSNATIVQSPVTFTVRSDDLTVATVKIHSDSTAEISELLPVMSCSSTTTARMNANPPVEITPFLFHNPPTKTTVIMPNSRSTIEMSDSPSITVKPHPDTTVWLNHPTIASVLRPKHPTTSNVQPTNPHTAGIILSNSTPTTTTTIAIPNPISAPTILVPKPLTTNSILKPSIPTASRITRSITAKITAQRTNPASKTTKEIPKMPLPVDEDEYMENPDTVTCDGDQPVVSPEEYDDSEEDNEDGSDDDPSWIPSVESYESDGNDNCRKTQRKLLDKNKSPQTASHINKSTENADVRHRALNLKYLPQNNLGGHAHLAAKKVSPKTIRQLLAVISQKNPHIDKLTASLRQGDINSVPSGFSQHTGSLLKQSQDPKPVEKIMNKTSEIATVDQRIRSAVSKTGMTDPKKVLDKDTEQNTSADLTSQDTTNIASENSSTETTTNLNDTDIPHIGDKTSESVRTPLETITEHYTGPILKTSLILEDVLKVTSAYNLTKTAATIVNCFRNSCIGVKASQIIGPPREAVTEQRAALHSCTCATSTDVTKCNSCSATTLHSNVSIPSSSRTADNEIIVETPEISASEMDMKYKCEVCSAEFKIMSTWSTHIQACVPNNGCRDVTDGLQSCSICDQEFNSAEDRRQHESQCPTDAGYLGETACIDGIPYTQAKEHKAQNQVTPLKTNTKPKKKYKCEVCSAEFKIMSTWSTHIQACIRNNECRDVTDGLQSCSICDQEFKSAEDRRQHESQCPIDAGYLGETACIDDISHTQAKEHKAQNQVIPLKTNTKPKKKYKCDVCSAEFKTISVWSTHIQACVPNSRCRDVNDVQQSCSICDQEFKSAEDRRRHESQCSIDAGYLGETACIDAIPHTQAKEHKAQNQVTPLKTNTKPKKKYKCDICSKSFKSRGGRSNHRKTTPCGEAKDNMLACGLCKREFRSVHGCRKHEAICPALNGKQVKLHKQPRQTAGVHSFTSISSQKQPKAADHTTDSRTIRKKPFKCQVCAATFKTRNRRTQHMLVKGCKVLMDSRLSCKVCHRTFTTGVGRIRHESHCKIQAALATSSMRSKTASSCSKRDKMRCKICNDDLSLLARPDAHYVVCERIQKDTAELEERKDVRRLGENKNRWKWKCNLCRSRRRTSGGMLRHIKTHYTIEYITCKVCKMTCEGRDAYALHCKVKHPPDKVKCPVCEKLLTKISIQSHLAIHSRSEMPARDFVCHVCGHGSMSQMCHLAHMQIHRSRRYMCEICSKAFARSDYLFRHMQSHKKEKDRPFKCAECDAGFTRKQYLQMHIKKDICKRPGFNKGKGECRTPKTKKQCKKGKKGDISSASELESEFEVMSGNSLKDTKGKQAQGKEKAQKKRKGTDTNSDTDIETALSEDDRRFKRDSSKPGKRRSSQRAQTQKRKYSYAESSTDSDMIIEAARSEESVSDNDEKESEMTNSMKRKRTDASSDLHGTKASLFEDDMGLESDSDSDIDNNESEKNVNLRLQRAKVTMKRKRAASYSDSDTEVEPDSSEYATQLQNHAIKENTVMKHMLKASDSNTDAGASASEHIKFLLNVSAEIDQITPSTKIGLPELDAESVGSSPVNGEQLKNDTGEQETGMKSGIEDVLDSDEDHRSDLAVHDREGKYRTSKKACRKGNNGGVSSDSELESECNHMSGNSGSDDKESEMNLKKRKIADASSDLDGAKRALSGHVGGLECDSDTDVNLRLLQVKVKMKRKRAASYTDSDTGVEPEPSEYVTEFQNNAIQKTIMEHRLKDSDSNTEAEASGSEHSDGLLNVTAGIDQVITPSTNIYFPELDAESESS